MHQDRKGLTIPEVREMIIDKKIEIRSLEIETLHELHDYEIEWVDFDKSDEPTIIEDILDALAAAGEPDRSFEVVSEERCMEIAREAIARTTQAKPVGRAHVFKKIAIIAAAALFLGMLGVTVYASYFGPFDSFVENVMDLFGMRAGVEIEKDEGLLLVDRTDAFYDDFETLLAETSLSLPYPRGLQTAGESSVSLFWKNGSQRITASYERASINIYLSNLPYTESEFLERVPDAQPCVINGYLCYDISNEEINQYILFYGEYLYIIDADTREELERIAQCFQ